jgi:ATP synthase protein I
MSDPRNNNPLQSYARYTSIGVQMLVIIFLGVFGGYKLDHYAGTTPLFIVLLSFAGVSLAIYYAVKDFLKTNNRKDQP